MEKIKTFLLIILLINLILSISDSIIDLSRGKYLNDLNNYRSLIKKKELMEVDTLLYENSHYYSPPGDSYGFFMLEGKLLSDNSNIKIKVWKESYLDYNKKKYQVYKSKLTNKVFLKNAPVEYFYEEKKSLFIGIYLKLSLFFIISLIFFYIIKFKNK